MTTIKNLGQVKGFEEGSTPPQNTSLIWRDTSQSPAVHKFYNTVSGAWEEIGGAGDLRVDNITQRNNQKSSMSNTQKIMVDDASSDSTVGSGWAYYMYLSDTDSFRKIIDEEDIDQTLNLGSDDISNDSTVTGSTVTDALDNLQDGGAGTSYQNTFFVDKNGDDSTAEKGNSLKPYKSPQTAINNASANDIVVIYSGDYTNETTSMKDGVDLMLAGARINVATINSEKSFKIKGLGAINNQFNKSDYSGGVITIAVNLEGGAIFTGSGCKFNIYGDISNGCSTFGSSDCLIVGNISGGFFPQEGGVNTIYGDIDSMDITDSPTVNHYGALNGSTNTLQGSGTYNNYNYVNVTTLDIKQGIHIGLYGHIETDMQINDSPTVNINGEFLNGSITFTSANIATPKVILSGIYRAGGGIALTGGDSNNIPIFQLTGDIRDAQVTIGEGAKYYCFGTHNSSTTNVVFQNNVTSSSEFSLNGGSLTGGNVAIDHGGNQNTGTLSLNGFIDGDLTATNNQVLKGRPSFSVTGTVDNSFILAEGTMYSENVNGGETNAEYNDPNNIVIVNGAGNTSYDPFNYPLSILDQATESNRGTAEVATSAETNNESLDTKIITPSKIGQWLSDVLSRALTWTGVQTFSGGAKFPNQTSDTLAYYDSNNDLNSTSVSVSLVESINNVNTVSSDYTVLNDDHYVLVDANSGAITITLPDATAVTGREYYIKKIDSTNNQVTLSPQFSQTIDGDTSKTVTNPYTSIAIVSNGNNWFII